MHGMMVYLSRSVSRPRSGTDLELSLEAKALAGLGMALYQSALNFTHLTSPLQLPVAKEIVILGTGH